MDLSHIAGGGGAGIRRGRARGSISVLGTGLIDEVCHLATGALGLLVLACFIDVPRRFYVAGLIASVAIDLDHIPVYLGLLGNQFQRPVTHSLATVLVFAGAAVVSRRHRAVLAGAATGLVIHFARDIAEGPPGVRLLWPVRNTVWTASFWWFLGMIIAFTVVGLVLVSAGIPHRRAHLFRTPSPTHTTSHAPIDRLTSGDRFPDPEPEGPDLEGASGTRLSQVPMRARVDGVTGRRVTQAMVPTRIVNQVELSEAERPAVGLRSRVVKASPKGRFLAKINTVIWGLTGRTADTQTNVSPPGKTGAPGEKRLAKGPLSTQGSASVRDLVLYTHTCLAVYVTPRMPE